VTDHIEVFVTVRDKSILAGRMYVHSRRGSDSASFIYDNQYLASDEAYELDPNLPLVTGTLQTPVGHALFRAFADSSPGRWGRTLIQRAERARAATANTVPRSMSEMELLLGVRDDLRQGALRFRYNDHDGFLADEKSRIPILTDLPILLDIVARVERDSANYEELRQLLRAGSSLGGARPKAHVLDTQGRIAIAKFPSESSDTWNVVAWEKTALDLARDAGIEVPASQLLSIGERSVLVIDRFDRRDNMRIGYASALTMLEASDGDHRSYLEIAEVIERHSPDTASELVQLWRRIAFTVLISNTDDHLRNHGFLHILRDSWKLSPAFDLNPNPEQGTTKHLNTSIDFETTRASVAVLLSVAPYFRLSKRDALAVLSQVNRAVDRWRSVALSHGLETRDLDVMEPAFEHDEKRLARQLVKNS
jgi:serine/threonine-protein kinase HipA